MLENCCDEAEIPKYSRKCTAIEHNSSNFVNQCHDIGITAVDSARKQKSMFIQTSGTDCRHTKTADSLWRFSNETLLSYRRWEFVSWMATSDQAEREKIAIKSLNLSESICHNILSASSFINFRCDVFAPRNPAHRHWMGQSSEPLSIVCVNTQSKAPACTFLWTGAQWRQNDGCRDAFAFGFKRSCLSFFGPGAAGTEKRNLIDTD